jgi:hypothetical protein
MTGAWNEEMQFPQQTIPQIVDSERAMVLTASQRFGKYYDTALDCVVFATQFLKSIDRDRWVFAGFQALAKKHLMLALFSTVRLHKEQAMMDLRQALEAGACAACAIANADHTHFVDKDKFGVLDPSQKLASKRYKWLAANYPDAAKAIQEQKGKINASNSHANLISAHGRSEANMQEGWFSEPFFDIEDEHFVKTDLWRIANSALTLLHVYYEVNEGHDVIKFVDNFWPTIQQLGQRNEALRQEMMASDRFQKAKEVEKVRTAGR